MSYKTMTGSSQKRFAILTKIVNYMKERHLNGEEHALSIEEILDETNQLDIGSSTKTVSYLMKLHCIVIFILSDILVAAHRSSS